jgi:gamma-glutamylcyclotransferase (GGCT)/AIG2-like uncharacterized protein YtfP
MADNRILANMRLASYGTLAPGKVNHHQLDGLKGHWTSGTIRGRLVTVDRGVHTGLIGLVIDPQEDLVQVQIFESSDLVDHWERLDAFETEQFRRVVATIKTENGELEASIYEIVV